MVLKNKVAVVNLKRYAVSLEINSAVECRFNMAEVVGANPISLIVMFIILQDSLKVKCPHPEPLNQQSTDSL